MVTSLSILKQLFYCLNLSSSHRTIHRTISYGKQFIDFYFSKFIVYGCLLIFCLLFALRLDEIISWSFWTIFLPLWIWKALVIIGAVVGSWVWFRHPQYRHTYILLLFVYYLLINMPLLACFNCSVIFVCAKVSGNT